MSKLALAVSLLLGGGAASAAVVAVTYSGDTAAKTQLVQPAEPVVNYDR